MRRDCFAVCFVLRNEFNLNPIIQLYSLKYNFRQNIFQFEWNAQFWFFRRKSFVSEIVNLSFANYSTTTDKSCLLENNYELPIEYIIDIVLKLMFFFAVRRRMESFWSTGVISLGEIIKTSFMAFLLPVEGNFTCCRAGGEFIPICSSSDPCGGETSGPHTFL